MARANRHPVIIFRDKSGTLPSGATNRSFFSNFPVTEKDGSIAMGSKTFVDGIKEKLQPGLSGRKVKGTSDHCVLKEKKATYSAHFGSENVLLSIENTFYLDLNDE